MSGFPRTTPTILCVDSDIELRNKTEISERTQFARARRMTEVLVVCAFGVLEVLVAYLTKSKRIAWGVGRFRPQAVSRCNDSHTEPDNRTFPGPLCTNFFV